MIIISALDFLVSSLKAIRLIISIFLELEEIKLISKSILSLYFYNLQIFLILIKDIFLNKINLRLIFISSHFRIFNKIEDDLSFYSELLRLLFESIKLDLV